MVPPAKKKKIVADNSVDLLSDSVKECSSDLQLSWKKLNLSEPVLQAISSLKYLCFFI